MVSIIVVTVGARDYLKPCLYSIQKQTYQPFEIIVVDNSGNIRFREELLNFYPQVKLYSCSDNLFYCEALNRGIQMCKGNFILCLNDDVILDKKFIEEALKGFSNDAKIGMVSGKILRQDRKTIDSTGLFLSPFRTAKERGYGCYDSGKFDKGGYIFGVNGAVAFYRRETLDKIKIDSEYFDNDFRFYYEDLDIAWRAQKLGWKGYYMPSAIAYHLRGGTARKDNGINKKFARRYINDELQVDLIKNRYLTMIKNETLLGFLFHLPFIILYDVFALGYTLLFRFSVFKKFFRKNIPFDSAFRKRKLLKTKLLYC